MRRKADPLKGEAGEGALGWDSRGGAERGRAELGLVVAPPACLVGLWREESGDGGGGGG